MMKKKLLVAIVAVTLSLAVQVLPGFALQAEEEWARVEWRLRNVQLSDQQKAKLSEVKNQYLSAREKMAAQVKESKWDVDYILAEEPFDKEDMAEGRAELRKLRDHWRDERRTIGVKIFSILTPEQRKHLPPSIQQSRGFFPVGRYQNEWARIEKRLSKVTLTDQQKTQLSALKSEFLKKKQDTLNHLKEAKWELDYIMSEEAFDKENLSEELEEMRGIRVQWKKDREAFGAKIFGILTPEQQAKLGKNIRKAQNLFPSDWGVKAGHGLGFGAEK